MADKYTVVRNGAVENEPRDPVLFLDVFGEPVFPETVKAVRELMEQAQSLEAFEVAQECRDWLIEHGHEPKVALADVKAPQYEEDF